MDDADLTDLREQAMHEARLRAAAVRRVVRAPGARGLRAVQRQEEAAVTHVLTQAEHEVARLWAAGLSCAAIAARRGTSRSTSTSLLARAKRALCADDRRDVAARIVAGVKIESGQKLGRPARTSRFGFEPGQRVRMTGGLYAGREGVYRAAHSSGQIRVAIGAGVVAVGARFVEAA